MPKSLKIHLNSCSLRIVYDLGKVANSPIYYSLYHSCLGKTPRVAVLLPKMILVSYKTEIAEMSTGV